MLNKQGPGKIDWCDWTWNPIKGCHHNCPYCYMLRMEKRFNGIMEPGIKPEYFDDFNHTRKVTPGDKIFVGSSGDAWGRWVPDTWIIPMLVVVSDFSQFTFQFLTKNPDRYGEFSLPPNAWAGTSVDGTARTAGNVFKLSRSVSKANLKFISFEPLLAPPVVLLDYIGWVIIGANSNPGAEKAPDKWADDLIQQARDRNIPVFVKDNYQYHARIKEFPANQPLEITANERRISA